jgi:2'-5' RNA ligase
MTLQQHYDQLWKKSAEAFGRGVFELDAEIDNPADNRAGLTLLIRPSEAVARAWQNMRHGLEAIDPGQYYYPASDLHLTVMSIISCYPGFSLDVIDLPRYVDRIHEALQNSKSFAIDFMGITASPSCILLQGFPRNEALNDIRNNIRRVFKESTLTHSIDKRYALQTAHITAVRFKKEPANVAAFLNKLQSHRDYSFGSTSVSHIELVFNDWYQRKERVTLLETFPLVA